MLKELNDVVVGLYRASLDVPVEEFPEWALARIKPHLPFDSATWGTGEGSDKGLLIYSTHLHNQPQQMVEDYASIREVDVVAPRVFRNPGQTVVFCAADAEWRARNHGALREYCARYEMPNILVTGNVDGDASLVNFVTLYRANADNRFTEKDRKYKQILMPHLAEALRLNRSFYLRLAAAGGNGKSKSMAIANHNGYLHTVEEGFVALLVREWPNWDGSKLPPAVFEELVRHPAGGYQGRTLVIRAAVINDLLFLKTRKRYLVDELTTRERIVAKHVAGGLTYKEIARRLGLAPATVRTYIQSIHQRLKVRNVAELIAQLRAAE